MTFTFDDIIASAQPSIYAGRERVEDEVTEGRDWLLGPFQLQDRGTGELIDLEAMGVTAEFEVYDRSDWSSVIVIPVTVDEASLTIAEDDTATSGKANGQRIRYCASRLTLTHTASGKTADVWGVRDSSLAIRRAD